MPDTSQSGQMVTCVISDVRFRGRLGVTQSPSRLVHARDRSTVAVGRPVSVGRIRIRRGGVVSVRRPVAVGRCVSIRIRRPISVGRMISGSRVCVRGRDVLGRERRFVSVCPAPIRLIRVGVWSRPYPKSERAYSEPEALSVRRCCDCKATRLREQLRVSSSEPSFIAYARQLLAKSKKLRSVPAE